MLTQKSLRSMSGNEKALRNVDKFGTLLWVYLDICWLYEFSIGATLLALPALTVNLLAFRYIEKTIPDIVVTLAINFWILMNALWIIGDIHAIPWCVTLAKALSVPLGLVVTVTILSDQASEAFWQNALARFRRLRISR
jgi:hypothetical protein